MTPGDRELVAIAEADNMLDSLRRGVRSEAEPLTPLEVYYKIGDIIECGAARRDDVADFTEQPRVHIDISTALLATAVQRLVALEGP